MCVPFFSRSRELGKGQSRLLGDWKLLLEDFVIAGLVVPHKHGVDEPRTENENRARWIDLSKPSSPW